MEYTIKNVISSSKVPAWGNKKQYIGIHYLGVDGQNHDLSSDGCGAHYYIYWDGTIYQRCSHDAVPWAVGTAGYYTKVHPLANNYNTISIEMCCHCDGNSKDAEDKKWYFTEETQKACVWLVQKLMKELNIPIENVLRHRDIVSKTCPAPYVHNNKYKTSWTWDEFKAKVSGTKIKSEPLYRVRKTWNDSKSQLGAYTVKENAINACPYGYKVFDEDGNIIYTAPLISGTQASEFDNFTEEQAAAKILEMAREDYVKTGILPSITAAQMILESGYVKTELATKANNCFGMKTSLSGNTWENSTWDGVSKVTIRTAEEYTVGNITYINADFRKYSCIEDSIADHSAYLLGAKNGDKLRYDGLKGLTDYKQAITLIKNGGYATDSRYVSKICNIIERFGLNKYDKVDASKEENMGTSSIPITPLPETDKYYRVGTAWKNGSCVNQIGAYTVLDNAKKIATAKSGYKVFDWDGNVIFPVVEAPTTSISYYRVGTAWKDGKCVKQLGAYTNLDNAKKKADDYGFKVFDNNGNIVYTAKPLTIPELAAKWAIDTANDNSHGYDNTKGSRGGTPDYACSSFVGAAYKFAGVDLPAPETIYTASMNKIFTPKGFKKITSGINFKTGKGLELGDIPVAPGKHTEIYVGDGKLAGARGNANSGKPENGKAGDQSGSEIAVSAYWNFPWSFVLRYVGDEKPSTPSTSNTYVVQAGSFSLKANADNLVKQLKSKGFNAIVKTSGSNYVVQCGSFSVKSNAESLKDKLIAAGFNAIIK